MKNGGPAFARTACGLEGQDFDSGEDGMSMRDYFAARAPIDVPEWFKHREPEYTVPPRPDYMSLATKEHQDIARDWQCDPCFDLPEELVWFGEKVKAYREAIAERNERSRIARFFQWRWRYADAMIAEREAS